jgi:hypothetical protein
MSRPLLRSSTCCSCRDHVIPATGFYTGAYNSLPHQDHGHVVHRQHCRRDSAAVADPALSSLLVFHHVDPLMSNWTETSEVARINRETGKGAITARARLREGAQACKVT